jgi:hypothetical protein
MFPLLSMTGFSLRAGARKEKPDAPAPDGCRAGTEAMNDLASGSDRRHRKEAL